LISDESHPELRVLIERCAAEFEEMFGCAPEAMAAAPGRVNLIGEHTDYNEGFVLPMAINRWCVAAGAFGTGQVGRVHSVDVAATQVYDPRGRNAKSLAPWARYAVGSIWKTVDASMRPAETGNQPLDVLVVSSVPLGSGLSSSASLECAVAALTSELFGLHFSSPQIAVIARAAEHDFAGVPCGIMDQDVSAYAEAGSAMLIDCRTRERTSVALPDPAEAVVVICDSGIRHTLGDGAYAERRAACQRAAAAMGAWVLRDADLAMLQRVAGRVSASDLECARHVITENARVLEFRAVLERGDLAAAGMLMFRSHASLQTAMKVSCPELDAMVAAARQVPGVFGSRMTGAGFGGCTVSLCHPDAVVSLCTAVSRVVGASGQTAHFIARAVGGVGAWRMCC